VTDFDAEAWVHSFETWGGSVFIMRDALMIGRTTCPCGRLDELLAQIEGQPERRAAVEQFVRAHAPCVDVYAQRTTDT
jgi:hypothetical protein